MLQRSHYTSHPPSTSNTDPFPFQCLSPPPLGLGGGPGGQGLTQTYWISRCFAEKIIKLSYL